MVDSWQYIKDSANDIEIEMNRNTSFGKTN